MKDALGHGSNPSGNTEAAKELGGGHPKSGPIPVHDALHSLNNIDKQQFGDVGKSSLKERDEGVGPNDTRAGSRDYDTFGRPRSAESKASYDEYNADLRLRSRNGQVGSGMRYRG